MGRAGEAGGFRLKKEDEESTCDLGEGFPEGNEDSVSQGGGHGSGGGKSTGIAYCSIGERASGKEDSRSGSFGFSAFRTGRDDRRAFHSDGETAVGHGGGGGGGAGVGGGGGESACLARRWTRGAGSISKTDDGVLGRKIGAHVGAVAALPRRVGGTENGGEYAQSVGKNV